MPESSGRRPVATAVLASQQGVGLVVDETLLVGVKAKDTPQLRGNVGPMRATGRARTRSRPGQMSALDESYELLNAYAS